MASKALKVAIPIVLLVVVFTVLQWWTRGFSVFTTYSHTLAAAGALPRPAPDFSLIDQFGNAFNTSDLKGRNVLLTLVYLSCPDVCLVTTGKLLIIHDELADLIPEKLAVVSISVDRERDGPPQLYQAWQRHGSPEGWRMAVLSSEEGSTGWDDLAKLGVYAFRRKDGFYNHSAYFFLLSPQGEVIHVFRPELDTKEIARKVRQLMQ